MGAFSTPHDTITSLLTTDANGEVALRTFSSAEGSQLTADELAVLRGGSLEEILAKCVGVDDNGRSALRLATTTIT